MMIINCVFQTDYPKVFKEMIDAMSEANDICDKNPRDSQGPLLATGKTAMEHFNWIVAVSHMLFPIYVLID